MADRPRTVKAALVQDPPVFLNLARSVDKALALFTEAVDHGARIVVFPETWLPGYPVWLDHAPLAGAWDHQPARVVYRLLAENALTLKDETCRRLRQAVEERGAYLAIGAHERRGGTLYNTLLFFDGPRKRAAFHRKLTPTYNERLVWGRGDGSTLTAIHTPFGRLGGLICWEHWMPLARAAMHAKNESIHVAQWTTVNEIHQVASRSYAFEGQCFVLASGCTLAKGEVLEGCRSLGEDAREALPLLESMPGGEDALLMRGGSAAIDPGGRYVTEPLYDAPGIVYADLNLDLIDERRLTLDSDGHYARPDVFELIVNETPQKSVMFTGESLAEGGDAS